MRMGAIGARGALLEQAEAGGIDLALKADTGRLRLVLEGGRRFALSQTVTLRPSFELGLRS